MEQQKNLLRGIESLSEQEKLELFNVEELETRLEMQIFTGGGALGKDGLLADTNNSSCTNNGSCW